MVMVMACAAVLFSVVSAAVVDTVKPSQAAKATDLAAAAEDVTKSLEEAVADDDAFKKSQEDVEHKGYVIALLANAVSESEGDAKWKGRALAVRDAGVNLAKAKSVSDAQKALKEIQGLFGGGEAGDRKPMNYLDIATLEHVMKEVNDRDKLLNRNLKGTQFARNKENIVRDANVWALLAAIARADTKTAEQMKKPQADYDKHCDEFFKQAKNLAAAAGKGDQAKSTEARKAAKAACTNCHTDFRISE